MKNKADELSMERNSSVEIQSITSESIAITAGIVGVVVECQFGSFPVRNNKGGEIGGYGDTSISLTSTAFDTEVAYNTADADLANGEFWVDYLSGTLRGKKKDASTSMTADYKIAMLNISVDDIEVTASQNIEELGGNAIDLGDGIADVGTQRITLANFNGTIVLDEDADETAQVLSASPGNLYGLTVDNLDVAKIYIQLFDASVGDVTVGTTTPIMVIPICAAAMYDGLPTGNKPIKFNTACTYAVTSTPTGAGAPGATITLTGFYQ